MAFRNRTVTTGGSVSSKLVMGEVPTGAINGINKTFTVANAVFGNAIDVFLNGLLQKRTDDYTFTSPATITFTDAPVTDSNLLVDYIKA